MAEPVYGLSATGIERTRETNRRVLDSGIEHPFHRRQQPVPTNDLVYCRYTGTSSALGDRTGGGIVKEGDCEIVEYLRAGLATPATLPTGTMACWGASGIVLPQEEIQCFYAYGKYWPAMMQTQWRGTLATDLDQGVSVSIGDATLSYDAMNSVDVEVQGPCNLALPLGTVVWGNILRTNSGCVLWVDGYCCPA